MINHKIEAIGADLCGALWPSESDCPDPLIQFLAESSRTGVLDRPNLADQPKVAEDRNGFSAFGGKATIGEPHE